MEGVVKEAADAAPAVVFEKQQLLVRCSGENTRQLHSSLGLSLSLLRILSFSDYAITHVCFVIHMQESPLLNLEDTPARFDEACDREHGRETPRKARLTHHAYHSYLTHEAPLQALV
jgi:hypothetical protein